MGEASAARAAIPTVEVHTVTEGLWDLSGMRKLTTSETLKSRESLRQGATGRPVHSWPSSCLPAQSPLFLETPSSLHRGHQLLEECPQAPARPIKAG